MGGNASKKQSSESRLDSPNVNFMRCNYGTESVEPLSVWVNEFGFPQEGSFSIRQLQYIEDKIGERIKKAKRNGKVSRSEKLELQSHVQALVFWKEESMYREQERTKSYETLYELQRTGNAIHASSMSSTENHACHAGAVTSGVASSLRAPLSPTRQTPETSSSSSATRTSSSSVAAQGLKQQQAIRYSATRSEVTDLTQFPDDDNNNTALTLPMIEVAGNNGPVLVFRPWTESDIREAMVHLPQPRDSGKKFAIELNAFCREFNPTIAELKRLLILKIGATEWQKLKEGFPPRDSRRQHREWDHIDNYNYRSDVNYICAAIERAFPQRMDTARISACKQKDNESVQDYYARLVDIFETHSGIEQPTQLGDAISTWEAHLRNSLLQGLRPEVAVAAKKTCIAWQDARLAEVRRHAMHAEEIIKTEQKKRKEKMDNELHMASLAMYRAVEATQ